MLTTAISTLTCLIRPVAKADESSIEGSDMLWGTYGKSGKERLRWVMLRDCETDHLQAILRTQPHVYWMPHVLKAIREILTFRGAEIPLLMHR